VILNHGGRIVKNTGDGFLLEFPGILGAMESAIGTASAPATSTRNGSATASSPAKRSATNGDGKPIHGNSVLGHSLEGTPGPDKPVIGRLLTEDERFDLIEYLKTL
jgi:hypothetical protein